MKTIKIKGCNVRVPATTYRCIEKTAKEKKMSFSNAVFYYLMRSIDPSLFFGTKVN
jgi:hypothetical protein